MAGSIIRGEMVLNCIRKLDKPASEPASKQHLPWLLLHLFDYEESSLAGGEAMWNSKLESA